jgi:hypothetical protein
MRLALLLWCRIAAVGPAAVPVARFVGVETGLDERRRSRQLSQAIVIEIRQRDLQPVDLRQRDFPASERGGDPHAVPEQPVRIASVCEQRLLDDRRFGRAEAAVSLRCPPDEQAFRAEHCALLVDDEAATGATSRIEAAPFHENTHVGCRKCRVRAVAGRNRPRAAVVCRINLGR